MRYGLLLGALLAVGCNNAPIESFTVTYPSLMVDPGVERTQCVTLSLHNSTAVHIGQIHNMLSQVSHHMIVYRVTDTVEAPTPVDCQPFVDTLDPNNGSPMMITQKKDDLLNLPSGVAYTLQPNQMLRLEMHYINATSSPQMLTGSSTMTTSHTYHDEANFLFIGNPDIKIPAGSSFTLGPTYFPLESDTFGGANFFAFTGHEHQWGTGVTVQTAANATDTAGQMVYDVPNWVWSDPLTTFFDPPVQIPDGGGFNFTCQWENQSDATVKFGESANDEMCFFWAYYYPSKGAYVCIHTAQDGGHDFCCPGDVECAFIQQALGM
ncbi:MAG TPA: hypothetical protein VGL86_18760 [Polyangia bacterium]|jgi:hypothetical protein